jgi:hypothetical protein
MEVLKLGSKNEIMSSCYARQCHPETCCCRDKEMAVITTIREDEYYENNGYNPKLIDVTVFYGNKNECEKFIEEHKDGKPFKLWY